MRLQAMHRRKTERYILSDARSAATSIQAAYRGTRARNSMSPLRGMPSQPEAAEPNVEASAAASIQAIYRGSRQRREVMRQTKTNALIEFMNAEDDPVAGHIPLPAHLPSEIQLKPHML